MIPSNYPTASLYTSWVTITRHRSSLAPRKIANEPCITNTARLETDITIDVDQLRAVRYPKSAFPQYSSAPEGGAEQIAAS